MTNRYAGTCGNCGEYVAPRSGKWRLFPKQTQNFNGLRCEKCCRTTKKNKKMIEERKIITI